MTERVYVVPRSVLFPHGAPHGFARADADLFGRIYARGFFADRDRVEEDPALKQVIPYAVLQRGREIFLFRRTEKGGERRLHGLRSIGVGGHVNPVDAGDVVHHALRRELLEELRLPARWDVRVVGLVNNDTTSVGSVHVGIVAVVRPGPGPVEVREEDTMTGAFVGRTDLLRLHARERESFEGWSALLLDRFEEVLVWDGPDDSISPTPRPTPTSTT
ncbi:MAG: NUDIX domain-containing protein [Planctomycetota bacterium]|jgi:predicted NUDIX family phosphoesterase